VGRGGSEVVSSGDSVGNFRGPPPTGGYTLLPGG
jgi:hypothetical protein